MFDSLQIVVRQHVSDSRPKARHGGKVRRKHTNLHVFCALYGQLAGADSKSARHLWASRVTEEDKDVYRVLARRMNRLSEDELVALRSQLVARARSRLVADADDDVDEHPHSESTASSIGVEVCAAEGGGESSSAPSPQAQPTNVTVASSALPDAAAGLDMAQLTESFQRLDTNDSIRPVVSKTTTEPDMEKLAESFQRAVSVSEPSPKSLLPAPPPAASNRPVVPPARQIFSYPSLIGPVIPPVAAAAAVPLKVVAMAEVGRPSLLVGNPSLLPRVPPPSLLPPPPPPRSAAIAPMPSLFVRAPPAPRHRVHQGPQQGSTSTHHTGHRRTAPPSRPPTHLVSSPSKPLHRHVSGNSPHKPPRSSPPLRLAQTQPRQSPSLLPAPSVHTLARPVPLLRAPASPASLLLAPPSRSTSTPPEAAQPARSDLRTPPRAGGGGARPDFVVVVDTNVLIHKLSLIANLKCNNPGYPVVKVIWIPARVIRELDGLKKCDQLVSVPGHGRTTVGAAARRANLWLERELRDPASPVTSPTDGQERRAVERFHARLDQLKADDFIRSWAMQVHFDETNGRDHAQSRRSVVLLSDDVNLRTTTFQHGVRAESPTSFVTGVPPASPCRVLSPPVAVRRPSDQSAVSHWKNDEPRRHHRHHHQQSPKKQQRRQQLVQQHQQQQQRLRNEPEPVGHSSNRNALLPQRVVFMRKNGTAHKKRVI